VSPWLALVCAGLGAFVVMQWTKMLFTWALNKPLPRFLKPLYPLMYAALGTLLLLPTVSWRLYIGVTLGASGVAWVIYEATSCLQASKDHHRLVVRSAVQARRGP
jgi:hypothetical protein